MFLQIFLNKYLLNLVIHEMELDDALIDMMQTRRYLHMTLIFEKTQTIN